MQAGVPVLSSDIPGVRQPVTETGFGMLVPPADGAAITAALTALRDEPLDRVAGAEKAERAFSVSQVLDAYEALLDKASFARSGA